MTSILKRKKPHIWTGSPHKDDGKKILTITLDNGAKLPLRFKPEEFDPEKGEMVQLGEYLATLNPQQSANLIEKAIKQQYDVSMLALASAAIGEFADGASFGVANWLGSHMAAAVGVGEGDYDARLQQARDSARVERTQAQSQHPNLMALAEGTGVAANPLTLLPFLGAAGKGVSALKGANLGGRLERAVLGDLRTSASAAPRVNYGVLNPAVVAHPGRLASMGEAAGKGATWGYAANALNRDTGEVNIDPAAARSGAEFAGGIQGLLNMAGPIGRALGRVVPRRPQAGNALPGETLQNSDFARRRLAAAHEDFSTIDSLFGESIDPTVKMRQAHDAALREGVDTFGNIANIPSLLGPQAEALAVQSAKVAPRSGQRLMDMAAKNAALQRERLQAGLLDSANVPRETAEQSLALEREAVEQASATHRDLAYRESVPMTGSINSLKAFDGWDKIYRSIRSDRKSQVKGSDDPLPRYDPDNGMPNLLPKSFNDFIDGFRYIPIRQYNKLVNKHGGDLPFERVEEG
jgi:hypothetical protein